MFKRIIFAIAVSATPAISQSFESMQLAMNLGTVLGSEEACGLQYDQSAISAWIDQNVEPSDMEFASSLNMMTGGTRYAIEDMSQSALTAHCRTIERTARHFGFVHD